MTNLIVRLARRDANLVSDVGHGFVYGSALGLLVVLILWGLA